MHNSILWEEVIEPGAAWSHVVRRGITLRMTDVGGGANAGAIFYNYDCPSERLNIPDTLKAQHIARLTSGCVLYSDMGRILCSITDDTVGWHDPLAGTSDANEVLSKYGSATYQDCRNNYHKNGYDNFVVELGKWGLGLRDLVANVNFFSRVNVGNDGTLDFVPNNSGPGSYLDLRFEMNVLAILTTCQHPLDPNPKYDPKPIRLQACRADTPGINDPCRISRPENARGFLLTERYFL